MPRMMRSVRTFAHLSFTVLGLALVSAGSACSTGGSGDSGTDSSDQSDDDTSPDAQPAVCGDGICRADEIGVCAPDCGAPDCDDDGICDPDETAATCADCGGATCDNDGLCEGGETPANCANDCTVASDCGDCDPSDTQCITDHCGQDQACLQSCLPSGFDCAALLCPAFGLDEPFCSLFCGAFGV